MATPYTALRIPVGIISYHLEIRSEDFVTSTYYLKFTFSRVSISKFKRNSNKPNIVSIKLINFFQ